MNNKYFYLSKKDVNTSPRSAFKPVWFLLSDDLLQCAPWWQLHTLPHQQHLRYLLINHVVAAHIKPQVI